MHTEDAASSLCGTKAPTGDKVAEGVWSVLQRYQTDICMTRTYDVINEGVQLPAGQCCTQVFVNKERKPDAVSCTRDVWDLHS